MADTDIRNIIALSMLPGIGIKSAHNVINNINDISILFTAKVKQLTEFGFTRLIAEKIISKREDTLIQAEKAIEFYTKNNINILPYYHNNYPKRLLNCSDYPLVLFYKGVCNLDSTKHVAIVGTRKASKYGAYVCSQLIEQFTELNINPVIISGLAYGIDIIAHKEALKKGLQTIGVLGHGMDIIYPATHRNVAKQMVEYGGILTEFLPGTLRDPSNFVKRNRIIAGLSDCLIVIESAEKGGSLITADLAISYNRDVFAIPGPVNQPQSVGCNNLIKTNRAGLIDCAKDIAENMNWSAGRLPVQKQIGLFAELEGDEKIVVDILKEHNSIHFDQLCSIAGMTSGKLSLSLLNLECKGLVKSSPGKYYGLL
ncbi:MAG: DNA-processing protein DprA [Bacteroidales bacterium]|jgi:DNA processing protein|nr:DNA-processing protein DprA [Bacteroidales bacterium]